MSSGHKESREPPFHVYRAGRESAIEVDFAVSLRGLMLLVLVVGVWMGLTISRAESRRKAVAALKKNGAIILYDYESMRGIKTPTATVVGASLATGRDWATTIFKM